MSENIAEGWFLKKLDEVIYPPKKQRVGDPQNHELLTVKLHGMGIVRSGKYPKPTERGRPYYKRFEDELLIGRQNFHNGGLGLVKTCQSGLIASNAISSFLPRDNNDIRFIHQVFSTEKFQNQVNNLSSGTGQKETSENQILQMKISMPCFEEQKKIASILTLLDELIGSVKQQLRKIEDLNKATMNELFSKGIGHHDYKDTKIGRIPKEWEIVNLGDILTSRPSNGVSPPETQNSDHLLSLSLSCITKDGFIPTELKRVETRHNWERSALVNGDFLLSRSNTRDLVGLVGIISNLPNQCIYPDLMMRLNFNEKVKKEFLEFLMLSPIYRKVISNLAQGTSSTMVKLNSESVSSIPIVIPSTSEQNKIAHILISLRERVKTQKLKLTQTQSLKKSLMQDLLTGKVRVQVN